MKTNSAFILTLVVLIGLSCKDAVVINPDLLVNKKWVLSDYIKDSKEGKVNYYAQMQSCDKDDTLIFLKDGFYKWSSGLEACNPDMPSDIDGTWELKDNNKLILDRNKIGYMEIIALEPNKVVFTDTITDKGVFLTRTISYKTK